MSDLRRSDLLNWCRVPVDHLEAHPDRRVPLRICPDSATLGRWMAETFVEEIRAHNRLGEPTVAIVPCGPSSWYRPFSELVNRERVSLHNLVVFHMDECLDWQGRELPVGHPFNFRATMETLFYAPIDPDLAVPLAQRHFLNARNTDEIRERVAAHRVDLSLGGWGQDGHLAYNQARRNPYSPLSLNDLRQSTIRVQENNADTILALAHRNFGAAYQFVPPMSVTLGVREVLSARKVRVFSDTGAWKQTALRVALFAAPTTEYPLTLLQDHPDALITATMETAQHPCSLHPEWDFGFADERGVAPSPRRA